MVDILLFSRKIRTERNGSFTRWTAPSHRHISHPFSGGIRYNRGSSSPQGILFVLPSQTTFPRVNAEESLDRLQYHTRTLPHHTPLLPGWGVSDVGGKKALLSNRTKADISVSGAHACMRHLFRFFRSECGNFVTTSIPPCTFTSTTPEVTPKPTIYRSNAIAIPEVLYPNSRACLFGSRTWW